MSWWRNPMTKEWYYQCIYSTYSDALTHYHTYPKISTNPIYCLLICLKATGWVANGVNPDQMWHSVTFDLSLLCLLRPDCPNTSDKYSNCRSVKALKWKCLFCLFFFCFFFFFQYQFQPLKGQANFVADSIVFFFFFFFSEKINLDIFPKKPKKIKFYNVCNKVCLAL